MIPLSLVQKRVPQIFKDEATELEKVEIRFPWQKVLKLIQDSEPGSPEESGAAAESLALKLKKRRSVRNIVPGSAAAAADSKSKAPADSAVPQAKGPAGKQVAWFSRPTIGGAGDSQAPARPSTESISD